MRIKTDTDKKKMKNFCSRRELLTFGMTLPAVLFIIINVHFVAKYSTGEHDYFDSRACEMYNEANASVHSIG